MTVAEAVFLAAVRPVWTALIIVILVALIVPFPRDPGDPV